MCLVCAHAPQLQEYIRNTVYSHHFIRYHRALVQTPTIIHTHKHIPGTYHTLHTVYYGAGYYS